jgi:hypothetical protein
VRVLGYLGPGPTSGLPVSSTLTLTMSPRQAGGEYGEVRAGIDEVKLNAYLATHVPNVTVPVTIKQFKVCR